MSKAMESCGRRVTLSLLFLTFSLPSGGMSAADEPQVSFYRDVRPILTAHCVGCHQPAKASGSYEMTTFKQLLAGGDRGEPAVVPGKPDESLLLELIIPVDGEAQMPMGRKPLAAADIETIRGWIKAGARDDSPADEGPKFDAANPPLYTQSPVISSIDYSPDGQLIAIAGHYEVRLHRSDNLKLVGRLIGLSERIETVRFSPDGKQLAAAAGNPARRGELQVWDVESQELTLSLPIAGDTIRGASWSPNGKLVAFGCPDNTIRAIDAESGEQVLFQGAPNDWSLDTVFSVDGSHLVAVGRDMTVKLVEVPTQRFVDNITSITPGALKGGIHSVARHPARDEVLVGGADGVPRVYRMHRQTKRVIGDDANLLLELPPLKGRVFGVDFSQDGTLIAAGSSLNDAGAIHVYRVQAKAKISEEIQKLLFKPTHSRSAKEKEKLSEFHASSVEVVAQIPVTGSPVYTVSISPDGKSVATAGGDGVIRIIDTASAKIRAEYAVVEVSQAAEADAELMANMNQSTSQESDAVKDQPLPADAQIKQLTVEPSSLELSTTSSPAQILVTAQLKDGRRFDVTRFVELTFDEAIAAADGFGRLRPIDVGEGTLSIKLGDAMATIAVSVAVPEEQSGPDYVQDVSPVLARAGCNAGTCHGAQDGKNGFKLSLRGYDPLYDVRSLTDDLASRRVNLASPEESLMLLKGSARVPHEGGQVLPSAGRHYQIIKAWIESGAGLDLDSPRVSHLAVSPTNPVIEQIGGHQQVRVVAHYTDGGQRDVTADAFIESGNTDVIVPLDENPGLMRAVRRGESALLVRYEGAYAATSLTVMGDRSGFEWRHAAAQSRIDELVADKLRRTKTSPAEPADTYSFMRRVHLDLTGLPPTPEAIRKFVADQRSPGEKRTELIDRLVGSDDFIDHWTNKWADLLQVNGKFLGREGATALRDWIRKEIASNTPYDQFARKVLTASGSNRENPAASYYKTLRTPQEMMENTTHLFLGTRFNCNKCHDHPFERWTQDQYYELSAYFAQVKLERDPKSGKRMIGGSAVESGKPLYEIVADAGEGEIKHDRTGAVTPPAFPFECDFETPETSSRREQLAQWISSADNPYFARSYVNRIWGYLLGTGIIEPIDDIRAGNPPTNPELLDYLTEQFVENEFDVRHLIRLICNSETYQRSVKTDRWNADDSLNFSHAIARRLPAEVMYDAVHQVTGSTPKLPGVPVGTRAAALPDAGIKLPDGFLDTLGRPARESACECERVSEMQLGPVMALVSGPTIGMAISDPKNKIAELAASDITNQQLIEEIYLRVVNRPPTAAEVVNAKAVFIDIQDDHKRLVQQQQDYFSLLQPQLAKQELDRQRSVVRLESELALHRVSIAAEKKQKAAAREKRIAAAEAEIESHSKHLLTTMAAWEKQLLAEQTSWLPVDPQKLKTTIKGELVQESGSVIFAKVEEGKGEYQVTGTSKHKRITAVRLEALADKRLPEGGPGWAGNFVLSEFHVSVVRSNKDKQGDTTPKERVKLTNAQADFSQGAYSVASAIDGRSDSSNNGWAISPQLGKSHIALFEFDKPVELAEQDQLEFQLDQVYSDSRHRIGKFRLSTTEAKTPIDFGLPEAIATAVELPTESRTPEQKQLLVKHQQANDERMKQLRAALDTAKEPVPRDPREVELEQQLANARKPLPVDPTLRRLESDVNQSAKQSQNYRLTAAQDLTWALINSPAFLYNH